MEPTVFKQSVTRPDKKNKTDCDVGSVFIWGVVKVGSRYTEILLTNEQLRFELENKFKLKLTANKNETTSQNTNTLVVEGHWSDIKLAEEFLQEKCANVIACNAAQLEQRQCQEVERLENDKGKPNPNIVEKSPRPPPIQPRPSKVRVISKKVLSGKEKIGRHTDENLLQTNTSINESDCNDVYNREPKTTPTDDNIDIAVESLRPSEINDTMDKKQKKSSRPPIRPPRPSRSHVKHEGHSRNKEKNGRKTDDRTSESVPQDSKNIDSVVESQSDTSEVSDQMQMDVNEKNETCLPLHSKANGTIQSCVELTSRCQKFEKRINIDCDILYFMYIRYRDTNDLQDIENYAYITEQEDSSGQFACSYITLTAYNKENLEKAEIMFKKLYKTAHQEAKVRVVSIENDLPENVRLDFMREHDDTYIRQVNQEIIHLTSPSAVTDSRFDEFREIVKNNSDKPRIPSRKYRNMCDNNKKTNRSIVKQESSSKRRPSHWVTDRGVSIMIYNNGITNILVDVIVNPADKNLSNSSGISKIIAEKAGRVYEQECKLYIQRKGHLQAGQVVYTSAGKGSLRSNYVIHAVAHHWEDHEDKEAFIEKMKNTYFSCLQLANTKLEAKSIAVPVIESGPKDISTNIICEAVLNFINQSASLGNLRKIYLISQDMETTTVLQYTIEYKMKKQKSSHDWDDSHMAMEVRGKDNQETNETRSCPSLTSDDEGYLHFANPSGTHSTPSPSSPPPFSKVSADGGSGTSSSGYELGDNGDENTDYEIMSEEGSLGNQHDICSKCLYAFVDGRKDGSSGPSVCEMCDKMDSVSNTSDTTDDVGPTPGCINEIPKAAQSASGMSYEYGEYELLHVDKRFDSDGSDVGIQDEECGNEYETLTKVTDGSQPDDGSMDVATYFDLHLPGQPKCGTIKITYTFQDGIQGEKHPRPGHAYHGTKKMAYLPNISKGRRVLDLLKQAFKHKLLFNIGPTTLTDSDEDWEVVWGGITHKTSTRGGPENCGYPDDSYLGRVLKQLSEQGLKTSS